MVEGWSSDVASSDLLHSWDAFVFFVRHRDLRGEI